MQEAKVLHGNKNDLDAIKVYDCLRDYVKHEDNLINYRTTWNITVQSFLIATFGFTIQKQYELEHRFLENIVRARDTLRGVPESDRNEIVYTIFEINTRAGAIDFNFSIFLLLLAGIGMMMSGATLIAVKAARNAIDNISKNIWLHHHNGIENYLNERNYITKLFPSLTGGGARSAHPDGFTPPVMLPYAFGLFWICAVIFVLFSTDSIGFRDFLRQDRG